LSIARQNAVSQRNNILTDRNFIWFCGKNLGDTISLIKCSTVPWQKAWLCHHGQKEGSGTQTERQNEDIAGDEKKSTFSFRARKVDTFHSVFPEH
jgi:hypothetical protein